MNHIFFKLVDWWQGMSRFPAGNFDWCLAVLIWSPPVWLYPHFFIIIVCIYPMTLKCFCATTKESLQSICLPHTIIIWYDRSLNFTVAVKIISYFDILILSGILVYANPRTRSMCWFKSQAYHIRTLQLSFALTYSLCLYNMML